MIMPVSLAFWSMEPGTWLDLWELTQNGFHVTSWNGYQGKAWLSMHILIQYLGVQEVLRIDY